MAKKKVDEEVVIKQREINKDDVQELGIKLTAFPQKRIDGILVSSFEQWCVDFSILNFKGGIYSVVDPSQYSYWIRVNDRLKASVMHNKTL